MAVIIDGTNNNDKITATDGLIDLLSSVNFASEVTVPSFKVGSDIQIGNAGIITATTLVGNVQGNINHTSNLLLQISGSEKFRVGTSGQLGIGGANYGTSGQVLTSGGSGSAATWSTLSTDLVSDSSPQLGADLDVNNFNIKNGTAILDISTNQRFEFNVAGTEVVDINGGGVDITSGHVVLVDNVKAKFGSSGDMEIYHDGTDNYIRSNNGAIILRDDTIHLKAYSTTDTYLSCTNGGAVSLRYDNSTKFATTSTGVTISGNANFANNNKAIFGTGNDAAIYHNDTDFHIDAQESGATRNIYMTCGTVNEGGFFVRSDAGDTMFKALTDSSCFLYFDNSLKFRTMTDHCEIRGHLLPDTNNTDDIGSTSKRFRNIYTNDLNLSNKGSTNSVDNTWGDYTIQEGESDLFLINNRNGKKYKFNLTEVS